jgi:hypothetical protein
MQVDHTRRDWIWHPVFALVALIIPFLIVYEIIDQFRTPAVDFTLDWQTGEILQVPMQSSANTSGFMPGDIILAVNGIPYTALTKFSLGVSMLDIQRGDQRLTLELPAYPLVKSNWPSLASAILVALTYWGSSIWLLLRRFHRLEIRILFVAGQAIAISLLAPMANLRLRMADWPIHASVAALYLSAPLILHHYLTFPVMVGSASQRRKVLTPLYALWLVAFGGWLWGGFRHPLHGDHYPRRSTGDGVRVYPARLARRPPPLAPGGHRRSPRQHPGGLLLFDPGYPAAAFSPPPVGCRSVHRARSGELPLRRPAPQLVRYRPLAKPHTCVYHPLAGDFDPLWRAIPADLPPDERRSAI